MAIPLNKTATASYPRILGIRYDPAAFTLPDSTRAAWDWEANAEALQAINAAGGTVRRINGVTAELSGAPITSFHGQPICATALAKPTPGCGNQFAGSRGNFASAKLNPANGVSFSRGMDSLV